MKVIACLLLVAFIFCVGQVTSLQCYTCNGVTGMGTDYDDCANNKNSNLTTCSANTTNCFSTKLQFNATTNLYGRGCAAPNACTTSSLTNVTAACQAFGLSGCSAISSYKCCTKDKCNGGTAVLPQVAVVSALIAVSLAAVLQ
ncbi:Hypp8516 [Branchiostoma lanceolatum]|uniref:Hypp8516 protein n=1 Tax=Branchiostoma lanceolatum TaxID=7740 RepID=A0A8K0EHZ8_BRALA|nr:Hypp8516 [Branchiostoma lanceolatum]